MRPGERFRFSGPVTVDHLSRRWIVATCFRLQPRSVKRIRMLAPRSLYVLFRWHPIRQLPAMVGRLWE